MFSSSVTKRKCHKSRFRTFKFKSVLNSVSTTCTCNTNSGTSWSPSSYLSGGIEPHSLSSSNTNLASFSRLYGRIIYLPQQAGILSQQSQRVNLMGKYSNGRKILWMGSQTHQNLLSSSRVITKQFIVHDLRQAINDIDVKTHLLYPVLPFNAYCLTSYASPTTQWLKISGVSSTKFWHFLHLTQN